MLKTLLAIPAPRAPCKPGCGVAPLPSPTRQGGNDDNGLGERKIVSQSKINTRDTPGRGNTGQLQRRAPCEGERGTS